MDAAALVYHVYFEIQPIVRPIKIVCRSRKLSEDRKMQKAKSPPVIVKFHSIIPMWYRIFGIYSRAQTRDLRRAQKKVVLTRSNKMLGYHSGYWNSFKYSQFKTNQVMLISVLRRCYLYVSSNQNWMCEELNCLATCSLIKYGNIKDPIWDCQ